MTIGRGWRQPGLMALACAVRHVHIRIAFEYLDRRDKDRGRHAPQFQAHNGTCVALF